MMRPRVTKDTMQDLEDGASCIVEQLRADGQFDLAARVGACQVSRITRYMTGIGWGLCRTLACPSCRRWLLRRWCRRGVERLAHAAAGAVADVRVDVGHVPVTALHDAVRRWRTGLRNVRARQAQRVGGRAWTQVGAVGAVQIEATGGPWRQVRARAVVHHAGVDWQGLRDAVGTQWARSGRAPQ